MTFIKSLTVNNKIILSYLSFFFAMGFGVAGMAIPPVGFIHSSVLILIAQCLVLCATLLGLSVKFDLERKHFSAGNPQNKAKKEGEKLEESKAE